MLSSGWMITFTFTYGVIIWLDDNIALNIVCYHLDDWPLHQLADNIYFSRKRHAFISESNVKFSNQFSRMHYFYNSNLRILYKSEPERPISNSSIIYFYCTVGYKRLCKRHMEFGRQFSFYSWFAFVAEIFRWPKYVFFADLYVAEISFDFFKEAITFFHLNIQFHYICNWYL